jgi:hypothetical protein
MSCTGNISYRRSLNLLEAFRKTGNGNEGGPKLPLDALLYSRVWAIKGPPPRSAAAPTRAPFPASAAVDGRVAKKLGDGLMALLSNTVAQENDAERGARNTLFPIRNR